MNKNKLYDCFIEFLFENDCLNKFLEEGGFDQNEELLRIYIGKTPPNALLTAAFPWKEEDFDFWCSILTKWLKVLENEN